MVAQDASRQAMGHGLKEVEVLVRGPGAGRESAVRALQAVGSISLLSAMLLLCPQRLSPAQTTPRLMLSTLN